MLAYLKIKNFAVVEKISIDFSSKLNVLTGETGAGKSILIDALSLFFHRKVNANCFRNNLPIVVEALFLDNEQEYILRREITKEKSLFFLNDTITSFQKLKEVAERFLNIYSQNESVFLVNPLVQRNFLDQFSQADTVLNHLSEIYHQLRKLIAERDELESNAKKIRDNLDFLDFQINEINALNLKPSDEIDLEQRINILSHAEEIISHATGLINIFYQNDQSIYNSIASHKKSLLYLHELFPPARHFFEAITGFQEMIPDFSAFLAEIKEKTEYNETELNQMESQLLNLNRLKAKYKMSLSELLDKLNQLKKQREFCQNSDQTIAIKTSQIQNALNLYTKLHNDLRNLRQEKAVILSAVIEKELQKLEMKNAKFSIRFDFNEPELNTIKENGVDTIEFIFSSNPGIAPAPLKDIASGGELSRIMLVLKSLIHDNGQISYIFDEIDAGIGGKTAEFVGEKLRKIAETNQVLCISHLPQIASFAHKHFLITKESNEQETFSMVTELSKLDRIAEIARLMAGSAIDNVVLQAAENLLTKNSQSADYAH